MNDRYSEPDDDTEPEELDENGAPLSRLTPAAREYLDRARAALLRSTGRPA